MYTEDFSLIGFSHSSHFGIFFGLTITHVIPKAPLQVCFLCSFFTKTNSYVGVGISCGGGHSKTGLHFALSRS